MNYFILSLIPALIYNLFKMKKSFHMLQQNWYNDDQRYFKWLLKNPYKVLLQPDMFFIMFINIIAHGTVGRALIAIIWRKHQPFCDEKFIFL